MGRRAGGPTNTPNPKWSGGSGNPVGAYVVAGIFVAIGVPMAVLGVYGAVARTVPLGESLAVGVGGALIGLAARPVWLAFQHFERKRLRQQAKDRARALDRNVEDMTDVSRCCEKVSATELWRSGSMKRNTGKAEPLRGKPIKARKMTPAEVEARDREKAERESAAAAAAARLAAAEAWALLTDEERAAARELKWAYDEAEVLDPGRWSPPADGEPVRLLSLKEVAERTGMKERWIELQIAEPFPDPDGRVGSRVGWLQSTVDGWSWDRASRGARRGLVHFLTRPEAAEYLGLSKRGLAGASMPPADAVLGNLVGWLPATIDRWKAQRPGRGRPTASLENP